MDRIEAAGGVVVDFSYKKLRYLIVHRPHLDDWTLPKGRIEPGESPKAAARREVEEETGLRCEVLGKLSPTYYTVPDGRPKRVKYWLMRPVAGRFKRNDEVDAVTWLKRTPAMNLVSHVNDQAVLVEAHLRATDLRRSPEWES